MTKVLHFYNQGVFILLSVDQLFSLPFIGLELFYNECVATNMGLMNMESIICVSKIYDKL